MPLKDYLKEPAASRPRNRRRPRTRFTAAVSACCYTGRSEISLETLVSSPGLPGNLAGAQPTWAVMHPEAAPRVHKLKRPPIEEQSRNNRGTIESIPQASGWRHASRSACSGSGQRPFSASWTGHQATPQTQTSRMNPGCCGTVGCNQAGRLAGKVI
jgi:hypothetical protein